MKKHLICNLAAVIVLLCLPLSAAARAVLDPARNGNCSVTITIKYQGKLISGGSVNLYKVGNFHEDDGNYSFLPVDSIKQEIPELRDIQSPKLAEDLVALKSKLTPVTPNPVIVGGSGEKGTAEFRNLSFGLYLVVQETPAPGYEKTSPFLVSVPYLYNGDYVYDVKSIPKTELERHPKPPKPSGGGGGKLPQTGQLWWPVPVLVCAGLGSMVVGLLRRREAEDET